MASLALMTFGLASGNAKASPVRSMVPGTKTHKVVFQVDSDDETVMKHAISGSINATAYFSSKYQNVAIEIVANSSGVKMFRADTSPLSEPLGAVRIMIPTIVFSVCGSSLSIAEQKEGHSIQLLDGVTIVPYGVARLIELQESGWSYIHA